MIILIGLGNIGEEYANNRHNSGFLCINAFHESLKKQGYEIQENYERKFEAIICKTKFNGTDIITAKPATMMNLSGRAVQKIISFYKIKPENLIIIYDDIDLPLGTARIKNTGSAGTHNGMKSIISTIGNPNFLRVRLGIESRNKENARQKPLSTFVLSDFTQKERMKIQKTIEKTIEEIEKYVLNNKTLDQTKNIT